MPSSSRDSGFTLIELVVVMALLGTMMAIAVAGWSAWTRSNELRSTARELQSLLRETQQRAVTEGRPMCVLFDSAADTYTVFGYDTAAGTCGGGQELVEGPFPVPPDLGISVTPTVTESLMTAPGVLFTSRGTALPRANADITITVARTASGDQHVLSVEGLTGRVTLD